MLILNIQVISDLSSFICTNGKINYNNLNLNERIKVEQQDLGIWDWVKAVSKILFYLAVISVALSFAVVAMYLFFDPFPCK